MAIVSSSTTTYQSREIDSGNARAIFKVVTTTTVTTAPDSPVGTVTTESATFESVDYTYLIKDIRDSIGTDSTTISGVLSASSQALETIADRQSAIAVAQTSMETYQKRIKELGEGSGYRIKGPYEIFSIVTLWKLLIEEGKILDLDKTLGGKEAESLAKVLEYMQKINSQIPKEF